MSDYDFTEIARIVASSQNIANYNLEYQYSTNKGDGYLGSVRALKIIGTNKELDVVFKYSHRDPNAHETLPLREAYSTEIKFYEVVAPAFRQFQIDYNIETPFNNTANYYGCINLPFNECIALENIKSLGYNLWDRTKQIDLPHFELALKTFAKFHGTSMAMKQLNPNLFQHLTNGLDKVDVMKAFITKSDFYKQMSEYIPTLNIFDPISEKTYHDKLEYFQKNIVSLMDPVLQYHDEYDAILHGDSWCNNLMFSYKDSKVEDTKILDWQLLKTGSVVIDIAYFIYTISPPEYLDNLNNFLKMYHNTMAEHLKGFNLDIKVVYPYEVFWKHWEKFARYGLMMSFVLRKAMLLEAENAPDFAKDLDKFISSMQLDSESDKLYKYRMKKNLIHFMDNYLL